MQRFRLMCFDKLNFIVLQIEINVLLNVTLLSNVFENQKYDTLYFIILLNFVFKFK